LKTAKEIGLGIPASFILRADQVIASSTDFWYWQIVFSNSGETQYTGAVAKLVKRLHERAFELLIDLIPTRTGWMRLAEAGRTTERVDSEVQNATLTKSLLCRLENRSKSGMTIGSLSFQYS
jgi:hypothetical protein